MPILIVLGLVGLLAGVMSGMFGIGGGIVIVPALTLLVGFTLVQGVATSLAALLLPVGFFGAREYYRKGLLDGRAALLIALGLAITSLLGAAIALNLPKDIFQQLYGAFLLIMGARFLDLIGLIRRKPSALSERPARTAKTWELFALGLGAGVLSGMFGVGGDYEQIQDDPRVAAAGVDLVIGGSIHGHDSVDTLGLWGPNAFETGYDADYNETVRQAAVDAIVEAAENLQEAEVTIAATPVIDVPGDPESGTDEWEHDIRDPVIFDPTMTVARFTRADTGATIGTLVNWADHPEMSAYGEDNLKISAHFVHWLRVGIEDGVPSLPAGGADLPGVGGVTVFAQGALGGQIGSFREATGVPGPDNVPITASGHPKEQALGTNLARLALNLLASDGEVHSELPLTYRTARIAARLDNTGLQVAQLIGILAPHAAVGYDPDAQIGNGNIPWLPLQLAYLQVGPLGMVSVPGELHPELWVGGYDCESWSWGYECYDDTRPNLPNFDEAPEGPYMRDLVLANDGVEYPVCLGLAMDFVGYIVPAYNFVLNPDNPYLTEADGQHYEETYSLGPDVERHVVHPILELLEYRP